MLCRTALVTIGENSSAVTKGALPIGLSVHLVTINTSPLFITITLLVVLNLRSFFLLFLSSSLFRSFLFFDLSRVSHLVQFHRVVHCFV